MIYFSLVDPKGKAPTRGTDHSAGWDLYMPETVLLLPGERAVLDLGVSFRLPRDCAGLLSLRSWAAEKHQLYVHPGVLGKLLWWWLPRSDKSSSPLLLLLLKLHSFSPQTPTLEAP